jgi:taurine--2-oxoglutarate transaminase
MGLAAGVAAIQVLRDEGLVENAARMQDVMRKHMAQMQAKHPSVGGYRATGLFGALDLCRNAKGDPISQPYNTTDPAVTKLLGALRDKGLFTFGRWSILFCNPPLCVTEEQLGEAFAIIDECLSVTDEVFESDG